MIGRRPLLGALGLALAVPRARAQPAPVRLAVLDASFPVEQLREGGNPRYDAFFAELGRLGYREGENLSVLRLSGIGLTEPGWAALVAESLAWAPDIIFATPSRMALQVKAQTTTVPVVFVGGAPLTGGVVSNLARPGGNITGFSQEAGDEFYDKQQQLLLAAVPSASRFGSLVRDDWLAGPYGNNNQEAATRLGIALVPMVVEGALDEASLTRAFETVQREPVSGLIIESISEFIPFAPVIARLALEARLPAISSQSLLAQAGLLMSYGANFPDIFRRAAGYVAQILDGADPGQLPVQQPTEFDLVVNLRTAAALGLTLPPEIMLAATEVIE